MECINEFYIHNFKFYKCSEFNENVFINGISVYEVIRVENRIPVFLENHLNRLFQSADISGLNINESYCDFETLIAELIKKNKIDQGKIKIILHYNSSNKKTEKDLLIYFTPHYFPSISEIEEGIKVGICNATRINPNAKILNTEARSKANNTIVECKLFEVLLQDSDNYISEGSRSNIFFIKDNTVITPPEQYVLGGITRLNIIKICKQNNIKLTERKVHFSELQEMDSAFISGTSLKVLPVKEIGNIKYNSKNSILIELIRLYDNLMENYINERLS